MARQLQRKIASAAFLCIALIACGRNGIESLENGNQSAEAPAVPPAPSPQPAPTPSHPPAPSATPAPPAIAVAPLWESGASLHRSWTQHAMNVVDKYGASLVAGAKDVTDFCPAYFSLDRDQKIGFWVYLVSAIAKYESAFDPTCRFKEPGMGNDPVTHQSVYSEGLLQLSYQDSLGYKFCDEFDWAADSKLGTKDPNRTILDPFKNLSCGIRILNSIVARKGLIAFDGGHYWSTLQPKRTNSKVPSIRALTNGIRYCKK